jgi:hypothetical protein
MKTITRKQLQAYGLTKYQVTTITKSLSPCGKEGRSATFALTEIIDAIRQRLNTARLKQSSRDALASVLSRLLERLGNVVQIPFTQSDNPEIQKAGAQLLQAIARTDVALADLKAEALEIEAKYKVAL